MTIIALYSLLVSFLFGISINDGKYYFFTDEQEVKKLRPDGCPVNMYAQWTKIFNLKYNLDSGIIPAGNENPTSYTAKTDAFTLVNPTRDGYTFAGWTGSNGDNPATTATIAKGSTGDKTYTANWTVTSYSITYDLAGGSVATENPAIYTVETDTFTLHNPTREGYTFVGWTGSNGTIPQTSVTVEKGTTGNLEYAAHWEEIPTPTPVSGSGSSDRSGGGSVSTYSASVTSASNGTVRLNKTNAAKGSTVTITATPNAGYVVNRVQVTDANGSAVDTTKKDETHYTFTMPAAKVTVAVTFQPENAESTSETEPVTESIAEPVTTINPFADVQETDFFYAPVLWAVENGITGGVDENHFAPYDTSTRAQAITFLWRAAGFPEPAGAENPFTDVNESDYFYPAVLWGYENGYVKGTSETTFGSNDTVTRCQVVTFLTRVNGVSDEVAGYAHAFTDVPADAYYSNAVAWAAQKGITNGTGENTFSPDNGCTRGEVVTFLHRNANL